MVKLLTYFGIYEVVDGKMQINSLIHIILVLIYKFKFDKVDNV